MLWRRLRKECRALIRRSLKFDETIWQNYDTLVHQYNLEKSEHNVDRMGRALKPLELLRRISKARSENFRLVPPFRMMLNEKRSDITIDLFEGCNNPNVQQTKKRMHPIKILSELTHRFYNEKLPKSPPQQLLSPRSNNSAS